MTTARKRGPGGRRKVPPSDLVLGLCHEVGNLLAATRLGAHLVANDLATRDVRETAVQIEAEAARAGAFLGLVRPLLATAPLPRLQLATAEVMGALERSLGAAARGPRQLRIRRPGRVPDVRVDPDALHHALVALVLAATDVTPIGRHVDVSAQPQGRRVSIRIEDAGGVPEPGPPPGVSPRRGRPLVLAAVAAVVEGQGGRVRLELLPRGARVEVSLPAYAASRSSARDEGSRTAAGGSRRSQTSPTAARPRSR